MIYVAWRSILHSLMPWRCKPSYIHRMQVGDTIYPHPNPFYIYVCPGCGRRLKEETD